MNSFPVVNPATGEAIRVYPAMSREQAHRVVEAVHGAFDCWRHTGFRERARLLHAAATVFRHREAELAALVTEEMGKTLQEAGEEAEKCAFACDFYAEHAEAMLAPQVLTDAALRAGGGAAHERAFVTYNPLGVVLALMPWNFPLWQVVRFLAPGLMASNACALKHANNTPGCALALESVFREAGFPPDLFRAVLVDIPEVEHLITHPKIAAVTLTGSVAAGRSVAAIAGRVLKKCVLELGGSDAYLILEDADLDLAAEVSAEARLRNAGQSCIAAKRFVVVEAVRREFEAKFTARMHTTESARFPEETSTNQRIDLSHTEYSACVWMVCSGMARSVAKFKSPIQTFEAPVRTAERLIAEAKRTGAPRLDLREMRLTSLPESIGQLSVLRSLSLDDNQLTSLPESLGRLSVLQGLSLDNNQLTSLPESVGQLSALETLSLKNNQLTSLPESLGQLSALQHLSLENNRLSSLPESIGQLSVLQRLSLDNNRLTSLPETVGQLSALGVLSLEKNRLTVLPESLGQLSLLWALPLGDNRLTSLPESLGRLSALQALWLSGNQLTVLPNSLGQLSALESLALEDNQLTTLPESLGQLSDLERLSLDNNPLNVDLAAAAEGGTNAIQAYLRALADRGTEEVWKGKLVLVGEGNVGKSRLLAALRRADWVERGEAGTTHGIEIKPLTLAHRDAADTSITFQCWDFGGQAVYRPTHQLFFSAPAIYLVVWKPREGPEPGFVAEWLRLLRRRAGENVKVFVVATHGGPKDRRAHIDNVEVEKASGGRIEGFFHVDSESGFGIEALREAIATAAIGGGYLRRALPKGWNAARESLANSSEPYMDWLGYLRLLRDNCGIADEEEARRFTAIQHELGHLICYQNDDDQRPLVILKPDWLSKAIGYVLEDAETVARNGLIAHARLPLLWNDPARDAADRYPVDVYPLFLTLMEQFDLTYRVERPGHSERTSLVAQMVPGSRSEARISEDWSAASIPGRSVQRRVCRFVDRATGEWVTPEGLIYRMIVRLHRWSLGRDDYSRSIHWQKGLLIDANYRGRALIELIGNDLHITVQAAYPVGLLDVITGELEWLNAEFWKGLDVQILVPCQTPCGLDRPGYGLFDLSKLVNSKEKGRDAFACAASGCNEWQKIDDLLSATNGAGAVSHSVAQGLARVELALNSMDWKLERGFGGYSLADVLSGQQDLKAVIEARLTMVLGELDAMLSSLNDEARGGPRLFSLLPLDPGFLDNPKWVSAKFQVTLWCEHTRLPIPWLGDPTKGVITIEGGRNWIKQALPILSLSATMLSLASLGLVSALAVPIARVPNDVRAVAESTGKLLDRIKTMQPPATTTDAPPAREIKVPLAVRKYGTLRLAEGGMLRELHALLKEKDPGFGGLVRVTSNRREFLWVHPTYKAEYDPPPPQIP